MVDFHSSLRLAEGVSRGLAGVCGLQLLCYLRFSFAGEALGVGRAGTGTESAISFPDLVMQSEAAKTVVFVESAAAMGGVQFSTLYLAQNLDPSRWHPMVLCPEEGDLTRACRDSGIEVHVLPQPSLWSTSVRLGAVRLPNPAAWAWDLVLIAMATRRLREFFSQCSPDVVVTKGLSSHF